MSSAQTFAGSSLTARLDRIERENRVLKRTALAILLVAVATIAMGQAPVRRTVVADEFILKDSAGMVRATLGFHRSQPTLTLFDSKGQEGATVMPDSISFIDPSASHPAVLLGSDTAVSYQVVAGKTQILDRGPGLILSGKNKESVWLRAMSEQASLSLYERAILTSAPDGPSLTLSDAQGFKTVVGSVSLATPSTGERSKTSAASVVLFDKDGKSIWSAPLSGKP